MAPLTLQKNLGKNTRPIKSIGTREIFYNSGKVIDQTDERKVYKSSDKFLRCKKKDKDKEIKKEKEIIQEKPIDTGLSLSTKQIVKKTFILINIITIFIIAVYLTKYLFKHEIAQRFIVSIVGTEKLGHPDILRIWRNDERCFI